MLHEHEAPDVAFEHKDVPWTGVIVAALAILLGTITVIFLLFPYFEYLKAGRALPEPRVGAAQDYHDMRLPVLQPSPRADLQRLREAEESVLNGANGQGISIERAMQIVAQHGLPPLGQAQNLQLWAPRVGSRLSGFDLRMNGRRE
jgi:hypothetical protein